MKEADRLYKAYPVIEKIDKEYGGMVLSRSTFRKLAADEYLSSNIEGCSGFLLVVSGMIKIQRISEDGGETNLYNITSGEICHEALSCYMQNKMLNIVGRSLCDTEICIVPFEVVRKYLVNNNEFLKYVYKDLHNKFNLIIENKEQAKHESLEERLVKKLLSYNSNIVYATHSELAFELDSAREAVSRKLKAFEREGYVTLKRGKIIIEKDVGGILNK